MWERLLTYFSQQGPDVFTQMRTDGSKQEGLVLDKLEHQVPVHALDGQLPVLILSSLGEKISTMNI